MYLAERFHDALKNGGRALLAGVASEQLPEEYRSHPRVICWDSDAPQLTGRRVEIPPRVRAVVLARFLSHGAAAQLSKASKRASAIYFGKVQGTGEIASMLRRAMPVGPIEIPLNELPPLHTSHPTQETMLQTPAADPTPFGSMTDAIRHFAINELRALPPEGRHRSSPMPKEFYQALAKQLQTHGFPKAKANKVAALFSFARAQERKRMEAPVIEAQTPALIDIPEPMPMPPMAEPSPEPTIPEPLPPDLELLVRMATELDVHAVSSIELAEQLRKIVAEQKELRATKARYDAMVNIARGNG